MASQRSVRVMREPPVGSRIIFMILIELTAGAGAGKISLVEVH
jgi:hypothetical protein